MAHGAAAELPAGASGADWSVAALATEIWNPRPDIAAPLLIAASVYAVGWWRLSRRGAPVSMWRVAAAGGGHLSLAVALLSPLDQAAHAVFAAHMLQHLLLISVAAPLLLLADPLATALWGLPRGLRASAGRLLRPGARLRRLWRGLTVMPVAWFTHALVIWLWHLPVAYDAAVGDRLLHDLEHLAFFASAIVFWWPVVQPAPRIRAPAGYGSRVVYLVLAAFQSGLLGLLLALSPQAWYRSYASTADQAIGGVVMWGLGGALDMLAVLLLLGRYLSSQDRGEPAARSLKMGGPDMAPHTAEAKGATPPSDSPGQRSSRLGEAVARLDHPPASSSTPAI